MKDINLKDLIKDNTVQFDSYRVGNFYYNIGSLEEEVVKTYQFHVPIEDIGTATLLSEDKAITFMRWIRKAIEEGTLTCINSIP